MMRIEDIYTKIRDIINFTEDVTVSSSSSFVLMIKIYYNHLRERSCAKGTEKCLTHMSYRKQVHTHTIVLLGCKNGPIQRKYCRRVLEQKIQM